MKAAEIALAIFIGVLVFLPVIKVIAAIKPTVKRIDLVKVKDEYSVRVLYTWLFMKCYGYPDYNVPRYKRNIEDYNGKEYLLMSKYEAEDVYNYLHRKYFPEQLDVTIIKTTDPYSMEKDNIRKLVDLEQKGE